MQERLANKSGRVPGLSALKKLFNDRIIASIVDWLDLKPAKPGGTQAAMLLAIIAGVELFHTEDGDCHADIEVNGHRETWPVRHKNFRQYLSLEFYRATGGAPNRNAMTTVLDYAEAVATHDAPMEEVFLRTARHGDKIYLDLADEQWRAIEIDATGNRIVARPPVRFHRAKGMRPLPEPVAGGKVDDLKPFLNVDDDDFKLVVGWLLGSLSGGGPYPVLCLYGIPGAAKSTLSHACRKLIDPNKIAARSPPREDRDLYIAGHNSHIVAFGNISGLPVWLSDALCRLATGEGFGTRLLYTDDEEMLFDGMRPVILDGIETFIKREDLADRGMSLLLSDIPNDKRRAEAEFWAAFEAARPSILGALLNVVAQGLRALPSTRPAGLSRMADFDQWMAACEPALGWEPGTFAKLYNDNRSTAEIEVLNADALGVAVQQFMGWALGDDQQAPPAFMTKDCPVCDQGTWTGTASKLLSQLNLLVEKETRWNSKIWPQNPTALGSRLRRIVHSLAKVGIEVVFEDRRNPRASLPCGRPGMVPQRNKAPAEGSSGKVPFSGG
jgi:hypothetical protein